MHHTGYVQDPGHELLNTCGRIRMLLPKFSGKSHHHHWQIKIQWQACYQVQGTSTCMTYSESISRESRQHMTSCYRNTKRDVVCLVDHTDTQGRLPNAVLIIVIIYINQSICSQTLIRDEKSISTKNNIQYSSVAGILARLVWKQIPDWAKEDTSV